MRPMHKGATMKQLWVALTIGAQLGVATAVSAQTPEAQKTEKPAILLPQGTRTVEYDPGFGFPDHNGTFSAMLVVIPKAELEEFNKPGGARALSRVARAEPGAVLAVKILMVGAQADANGIARVMSDMQVFDPSGAIYGHSDYKDLPVWVGRVGKGVYDNRDRVMLLNFEPTDPTGVYTIKAVVHDRFSQRDIPLQTTVELLPARQPAAALATPAPAAQPEAAPATPQAAEAQPAPVKAKSKRRKRRH